MSCLKRFTVCAMAAAAATFIGTGTAGAAPATVSIQGDMQLLGINVLNVDADATTDGAAENAEVTGTYVAQGRLGSATLPIRVTGPVTCLTVEGNTVSLIYPISTVEPIMIFEPDAMAIQITVRKGENGAPNMIGYGTPMPTDSFRGCAPGPTPLDFDGTIDIS